MKTWFIADDNGDVYAHDIQTETAAQLILADILAKNPTTLEKGIEVLEQGGTDNEQ